MPFLNRRFLFLLGFALITLSACEAILDDCILVDLPDDCQSSSDFKEGKIRFLTQQDSLNPSVKVKIFKGNIEENQLMLSFSQKSLGEIYSFKNGEYTAVAIYHTPKEDYLVVKVLDVSPTITKEEECYFCYSEQNMVFDLTPDSLAVSGED